MAKKRRLTEGSRVQALMEALAKRGTSSPSLKAWLGRPKSRPPRKLVPHADPKG